MKKKILSFADFEAKDVQWIVERAARRDVPASQVWSNSYWLMLFDKPSLRTRLSLELALHKTGGQSFRLDQHESDILHREPLSHIVRIVQQWTTGIVARTSHQVLEAFAQTRDDFIVLNALSEKEHPLQILADLTTVFKLRQTLNLQWCFIGDGNNVCHSLILASALLDLPLVVCTPKSYAPDATILNQARALNPHWEYQPSSSPEQAVQDADIVYTDTWVSMGQEEEEVSRLRVFEPYQVNEALLSHAHKDALLLHCLPAHVGQEITSSLIERKSIWLQAENRLFSALALLECLHEA